MEQGERPRHGDLCTGGGGDNDGGLVGPRHLRADAHGQRRCTGEQRHAGRNRERAGRASGAQRAGPQQPGRPNSVPSPATLNVSVSDGNGDPMTVTYYGRQKSAGAPDFTVVAIPDTSTMSTTRRAQARSRPRRTGSSPIGRRSTSRSLRTWATSPSTRTSSSSNGSARARV